MSRTDKDAPGWVRALHDPHAREHHTWRCVNSPYGLARPEWRTDCDLDNPVDVRTNGCVYWSNDRTRWYTGVAPGDDRLHTLYYGPERAAVRDSLRDALRDYNTYGETDIEPPTRQTRNSTWYGGYWD